MKIYKFDNTDFEKIEDLIPSIEKMYKLKFEENELAELSNFNQFCDKIVVKIDFENVENCTTQQAFYKLRKSLVELGITEKTVLNAYYHESVPPIIIQSVPPKSSIIE